MKKTEELKAIQQQELYNSETVKQYLLFMGYHATYWRGSVRGFYNPRNGKTVLIPDTDAILSKTEVLEIFNRDKATDLSADLEWLNLQRFTRVKDVITIKTS